MRLQGCIDPKKIILLAILSGASLSQPAFGTAFQMLQQNVSNMGTGYAGTAALAEDVSTNYYNAAGLTKLCHEQISIGGIGFLPHTVLNATRATSTTGTLLTPSTERVKPHNSALIPFIHYGNRINDRWVFGLSLAVPFGSKTNYKNESITRYTATRSEMKTLDLVPSLAYQFDHKLSVGAGIDALYMQVKSDLRLNLVNTQVNTDGFVENSLSHWAYGYHIGGLYEINPSTRLGLQYRSKFDVKAKGESLSQFTAFAPIISQGLKADFHMPDSAVLSAYHAFNDQWAAMADIQFTRWNRFKNVIFSFEDASQLMVNQNYKNTFRFAAGGTYQYNEPWRFRFGLMFDKSPIPDVNRNIFIPNQNQIVPAIGAQYRICKTLAIDFGYAHVFFKKDNHLDQLAPIAIRRPQGQQNLQGSIRNRLEAIGLQLTWDIEPS